MYIFSWQWCFCSMYFSTCCTVMGNRGRYPAYQGCPWEQNPTDWLCKVGEEKKSLLVHNKKGGRSGALQKRKFQIAS